MSMDTPVTLNTAVKYAAVSASNVGDNTLVAAQGAGKKIRVLSYVLVASAAATVAQFESSTGGPALSGVMDLPDNGILEGAFNPFGHFETAANALLNLIVGADGVYGHLTYIVIENPAQPS